MRQLQILIISAKTWHRIVCWFSWISLFFAVLAWPDQKIVLLWSAEQFYDHIMQKRLKTGKNTEINKQSNVKFWLDFRKYGAVSYWLSCKQTKISVLETNIFSLEMIMQSGLEFCTLKFHDHLQRYLLTCQVNSAFLGRLFCIGQQQLWKG